MALCGLREELELIPGAVLADGQPTWTLHDPVRNLYFRIDWPTFEVLSRWRLDDPDRIAGAVSSDTTLHLGPNDVLDVQRFLVESQLVQSSAGGISRQLADRLASRQRGILHWLLHHYLFFRIPLWRPDAWLARWQHVAAWFASRSFVVLTLAALIFGFTQVARQWDVFKASLAGTFNFQGLVAYAVALAFVKLLHELGHAFTAKIQGCRVPTMGVAFLVLWPVAYTDTNDVWRLTDRWRRLRVAIAGIATELVIAIWATLAWSILPEGATRSAAFVLATTSWVATLAVNASPFLRFDGYFILSDWFDFPNLHERSFAIARWRLREWLFGLDEPPPERLSSRLQGSLMAFAFATWIYRLLVFVGIALLVYGMFFKALGILLFAVEIAWFVLFPLKSEWKEWHKRWPLIRHTPRSRRSALIFAMLVVLVVLPWPGRIGVTGLMHPATVWPVFPPGAARIDALAVTDGNRVTAGTELARMYVPDLETRRKSALARIGALQWQADAAGLDAEDRARLLVRQQALVTAKSELSSVDTELGHFAPLAPFDGRIRDIHPDLRPGEWVAAKEQLANLVKDGGPWVVETWVDEDVVERVSVGDRGYFSLESSPFSAIALEVLAVDRDASRRLPRGELAVELGGHIQTRIQPHGAGRQRIPERAVYHVTLAPVLPEELSLDLQGHSWRGYVTIHGRWEAPITRYLRQASAVLFREAGF